MSARLFIDNVFIGFLHSLKGFVSIWNIDSLLEAKLAERYQKVVAAKEQGYRVPYNKLKPKKPPKVAKKVIQSCFINGGIFLSSIILFYNILLPIVTWLLYMILPQPIAGIKDVVEYLLNLLFSSFWIIPVYIATRVFNCLWWQDIADALFKLRPCYVTKSSSVGFEKPKLSISGLLADILLSVSIEAFFLFQAILFSLLPLGFLSYIFSTFHLSLLYALYAFEYKWWGQRCDVYRRLKRIENNVPYFLGFGLPLTLVSSAHQSALINGCIYAMLFPFLILSAFEASPHLESVPETVSRDFAFPVFQPVIIVSNFVFSICRKGFKFAVAPQ